MNVLKLKNKINSERGSITVFVLTTMIFFLIVVLSIYINNSNKNTNMNKYSKKLENQYAVTNDDLEQAYLNKIKGLTPLEYIESVGTEYIDTGIVVDNDIGFDISCALVETRNAATNMFGGVYERIASNEYTNMCYIRTGSTGSTAFRLGTKMYADLKTITVEEPTTFKFNTDGNKVFSIEDEAGIRKQTEVVEVFNSETPAHFYLGQMVFDKDKNIMYPTHSRLYYAKIYKSGELVRDFVPVLDKNGVPCLFDKVSGLFYYNTGTGYFKTNLKTNEASYTEVDYLEATGTQYINTGIRVKEGLSAEMKVRVDSRCTTENVMFLGARQSGTAMAFGMSTGWNRNNYAFNYGNGYIKVTNIPTVFDEDVVLKSNGTNFEINGTTATGTLTGDMGTFSGTVYNIYMFSRNDNGNLNSNGLYGRIYYCKIYDGSTLVRDYIPVLDGDGVPCMYDKVEHKYYYNLGQGSFKTNLDQ